MTQDYSSEFVYRPPLSLQSEFDSSIPIRFLTESKEIGKDTSDACIDCEAKTQWRILQEINLDNPNPDLIDAMKKIQDALIFVLENTDWPVSD